MRRQGMDPAFPVIGAPSQDYPGMTLRDYFAAKAMQGLTTYQGALNNSPAFFAQLSYTLADAMLKERDK